MKKLILILFLFIGLRAIAQPTLLTRQTNFAETAAAVTFTAVDGTNGNKISNADGKTILQIKNAGGSPVTVTIAVQNANPFVHPIFGKITKSSIVISVTNGTTFQVGPVPVSVYNDNSGFLQITYSSGTSMTIAAFSAP